MARKNRAAAELRKLDNEPHTGPFKPTYDDVAKWFKILNKTIFENTLPDVNSVDIRVRRKVWARYIYNDNQYSLEDSQFEINQNYRSKKHFVEILAHEMVHHFQYVNGQGVNHGPQFLRWAKKFEKYKLKLNVSN